MAQLPQVAAHCEVGLRWRDAVSSGVHRDTTHNIISTFITLLSKVYHALKKEDSSQHSRTLSAILSGEVAAWFLTC